MRHLKPWFQAAFYVLGLLALAGDVTIVVNAVNDRHCARQPIIVTTTCNGLDRLYVSSSGIAIHIDDPSCDAGG